VTRAQRRTRATLSPTGREESDRPDPRRDPNPGAAAAGDSISVGAWTVVSRVTGLIRFAAVGAVLGPTFLGNTYQFTNSLPNLVYYGFLAGSLFSSLLVPALVRHIDAGDRRASERIAGAFLGMALVSLAAIAPVAVVLGPLVLKLGALPGVGPADSGNVQEHVGRWLLLMFIPQIFCYGVVGTATAVMYARRRFALAAAAPAIENVGILVVLAVYAAVFGTGTDLADVGTGPILLLGLGTTGAVALHAAVQWGGARRAGVVLTPRSGRRDREVRAIVRRALPSLAQAGLAALQVLILLVLANRVPGGVVAFQIGLSFFYVAIALGAAPVTLALLPRLARMHLRGEAGEFRDTLLRGFGLGLFLTIPAAVGYLTLATPIARAVSFGRMNSTAGVTMTAVSIAALAVAVVAQTAFMIATDASYARKDTRSPLWSTLLQTVICLALVSIALRMRGPAVLVVLGLSYSASLAVGACHLTVLVLRRLDGGSERLAPSLVKVVLGAVVMAGPAWLTASTVPQWIGPPLGSAIGAATAALVGAGVFIGLEAAMGTPQVFWITGGLRHVHAKARRALGMTAHG
jgi:putative peptidoglycan lipid II flippase